MREYEWVRAHVLRVRHRFTLRGYQSWFVPQLWILLSCQEGDCRSQLTLIVSPHPTEEHSGWCRA